MICDEKGGRDDEGCGDLKVVMEGLNKSRVVQPQNLIMVRYRSITYCSKGFMLIGEEKI